MGEKFSLVVARETSATHDVLDASVLLCTMHDILGGRRQVER
jgi:hypothetical protein